MRPLLDDAVQTTWKVMVLNTRGPRYATCRRILSTALAGLALGAVVLLGAHRACAQEPPYTFGPVYEEPVFVVANNIQDPELSADFEYAVDTYNRQIGDALGRPIHINTTPGLNEVRDFYGRLDQRHEFWTMGHLFMGVRRNYIINITFNCALFDGAALPAPPADYRRNQLLRYLMRVRGVVEADAGVNTVFRDPRLTELTPEDIQALVYANREDTALPTYEYGLTYCDPVLAINDQTQDVAWTAALNRGSAMINNLAWLTGRSIMRDPASRNTVRVGPVGIDGQFGAVRYRMPGTSVFRMTHVGMVFTDDATAAANAVGLTVADYRTNAVIRFFLRALGLANVNPALDSALNPFVPAATLTHNDAEALMRAQDFAQFPAAGPQTETMIFNPWSKK